MTINGKAVSSFELWNAETLQRRWNKVEEPTMIKMTINSKAVSQRSWQIWHSYMLNSKTKMYRCRQVEQKEQQKQQWYHHRKWNAISKRRAMRRTCIHDASACSWHYTGTKLDRQSHVTATCTHYDLSPVDYNSWTQDKQIIEMLTKT